MNKISSVRVRKADGTFSREIPLATTADDVKIITENNRSLASKLEELSNSDRVQSHQINNLIKNTPAEEGEQNKELTDIRVGYDGVEYETAGAAVRALGNETKAIKSEIEKYIDVHAIDGLLYEDNKLYLTSNGEVISDPVEIVGGSGGGGGGSQGSVMRLVNTSLGTTFSVAANANSADVRFSFSSLEDGNPTGEGTLKVYVNSVLKHTARIQQGENAINVKEFLSLGNNNVRINVEDAYGISRNLNYTITIVDINITSTFDDTRTYDGDITFKYTPTGLVDKITHIILDGTEISADTIIASGKEVSKVISRRDRTGVHRLEVYLTADINGSKLESRHLYYDIIWAEAQSDKPLIASPFGERVAYEGSQITIPYTVYDPNNLECTIQLNIYENKLNESNQKIKTLYSSKELTVDRTRHYWITKDFPAGYIIFEIKYGEITSSHSVTIIKDSIDVEAETNDLELFLSSTGRSNNEKDPAQWKYKQVTTTFDKVNWSSTGWIEDENKDIALRLYGDARATINFQPFNKDLRAFGKTIEMEFAIRDVNNRDAVVIECMDREKGIRATADTMTLFSEQNSISCRYKENEKIRVAFCIENTNQSRLMSVYLNGVLSGAIQYPTSDNFQQFNPASIKLGSNYCNLDLYTVRVYDTCLNQVQVKNNFIADIMNMEEKKKVYQNNNIYDEYNNISYEKVKSKLPIITIVGTLPVKKGDKKPVTIIFEDPDHPELNFTDECTIDVQGTSSQYYVRKNWKLKFKTPHTHGVDMPAAKVFCLKVDYAEATGTHNTQAANFIETLYYEDFPAKKDDPKVRSTIWGYPGVIFHQEKEGDEPVFYGKSNFNYDKGAENVYGFLPQYNVESWEFLNNTRPECNFLSNIGSDWEEAFEARYPDEYQNIENFKVVHDWVVSTNPDTATNQNLQSPVEYNGKRYDKDTAEYRLAKFKNEFTQHFNMHFSLIYYVWSFFALMVDQRAKNMFITLWNGIAYPYFYDNDTIFGIDNKGYLSFDYMDEDGDTKSGGYVYNGHNSVLWNNFKKVFWEEIGETWRKLRSDKKITYDKLIDRFITQGSDKWSESIYNEDADFKYISMLRTDNDASNLFQIRGDGELHLKYFLKNRLEYCDSIWNANEYGEDIIELRLYTPGEKIDKDIPLEKEIVEKLEKSKVAVPPNMDITIVPYSWMYAGVKYKANGTLQQKRVRSNEEATFKAPNETFNDTETAIYGASKISSLVDLAPMYNGKIAVSAAEKLTKLKIGDQNPDYYNPYLKGITLGANRLLEYLDISNCPNLKGSLDLSNSPDIKEIYAKGTSLTGITLPKSGYLRIAHYPSSITNLTITNQYWVEDFQIDPKNLTTLVVENTPSVNISEIIAKADKLERVRLVNVEWTDENEETLKLAINKLKGLQGQDEAGRNIDKPVLIGTVHVKNISLEVYKEVSEMFPYLTVLKGNEPLYFVKYENYNGDYLWGNIVTKNDTIINPVEKNYISAPTKPDTDTVKYTFKNFGNLPSSVTKNATFSAVYTGTYYVKYIDYYTGSTYSEQWVTEGKLPTAPTAIPTKASDAQYIYTFSYWERPYIYSSRTLTSIYSKTLRKYPVHFLNNDRTSLYEIEELGYGSVPFYKGEIPVNPENAEEGFIGWTPSLSGIVGETTYIALYSSSIENKEISDSWSTIVTNTKNGNYKTAYKIGNYKILKLGNKEYKMRIVGIDVDTASNNEKAPLTFISEELFETPKAWNPLLEYTTHTNEWEELGENHWRSCNRFINNTISHSKWQIHIVDNGRFRIKYKTSSEGPDRLKVNLDMSSENYINIGGIYNSWQEKSFSCLAGEDLIIEATYSHDGSIISGTDTAELQFEFDGRMNLFWLPTAVNKEDSSNLYKFIKSFKNGTGNIGGWKESALRKFLHEDIKNALPAEIKNNLKPVNKKYNEFNSDGEYSNNLISVDEIWIPTKEEFISNSYPGISIDTRYQMKSLPKETTFRKQWTRIINNQSGSNSYYAVAGGGVLGNFNQSYSINENSASLETERAQTECYFPICFCL